MSHIYFPSEWANQSAVQLTWPHEETDWAPMLDEVLPCFINIAREVLERQKLIVVCKDASSVISVLGKSENLILVELPSDDTWARDHGGISIFIDGKPVIADFDFNGWGMKFDASNDNNITKSLYKRNIFSAETGYISKSPFILEGGSIESDGFGTLMTTECCLMAPNRNQPMEKDDIEEYLKTNLGVDSVLWIKSGYLAGDDTDGHVDMLARFTDVNSIAYVKALDPVDEHTSALNLMEQELKSFRTKNNKPYTLIPLPMAEPVYHDGERLPASYANFLIINGAVLMPTYNSELDALAKEQLKIAFPDREIIGINCLPLIKQHGSLHCLTMQYPQGFIK
jgi:agmatine/peptidylarginine deiminase